MYIKLQDRITKRLVRRNSYFKWSNERIAKLFNCSPRTVATVINKLSVVKQDYLMKLKNK